MEEIIDHEKIQQSRPTWFLRSKKQSFSSSRIHLLQIGGEASDSESAAGEEDEQTELAKQINELQKVVQEYEN